MKTLIVVIPKNFSPTNTDIQNAIDEFELEKTILPTVADVRKWFNTLKQNKILCDNKMFRFLCEIFFAKKLVLIETKDRSSEADDRIIVVDNQIIDDLYRKIHQNNHKKG